MIIPSGAGSTLVFMAPYLPGQTNNDILSLMPSSTTWRIVSNPSHVVFLFENVMMFQLLKQPNTVQYVKSCKVWYHGFCDDVMIGAYGLYNMY